MKTELLVMLVQNDRTVENAIELFKNAKDLPVKHWGFKDVGLEKNKMIQLVKEMKDAGKTTYLEIMSQDEEGGLQSAQLAIDCGFDVAIGTVYSDSINFLLKNSSTKYYPFTGRLEGHPATLVGSVNEIIEHGKMMQSKGVDGLTLSTYRFVGDHKELIEAIGKEIEVPIISAGSINSFERIDELSKAGIWGVTIGSGFFKKEFLPEGTFNENIEAVVKWINNSSEAK
ncbi:beta/alpha barrel domain-containing protein [Maledivibacter halophilus]|uniref:1-(5-phosphoribosyl)-5-[(5-phosphoribosylamino)methylideneamino] imidazole-4-carboxamide isomerase n=1 Tax=Maledivibacter halophilus TaxID=36842 RepID=A0A1T5MIJ6_9FIRM|nr:hypothetical protein [Maledivibacter halophilus]SKC88066.1 1-(5-phosphoribosyl)-5-[(5-phosphoribosylamino)methylideneamino] imidazole-4-carboxamide isomerase [Maledivibacter halophilus]